MQAETTTTPKGKQGFASLSAEQKREIAAKGGRAAHALGRAHTFTSEQARVAGKRGGALSRRGRTMSEQERAIVLSRLAREEREREEQRP